MPACSCSLARDFWPLLLVSALTGASWAVILPLGEAVALGEAQRRNLNDGRIRLWGSIAFILAAVVIGERPEDAGPAIVLGSIAAGAACLLGAVCCRRKDEGARVPAFLIFAAWRARRVPAFVAAAGRRGQRRRLLRLCDAALARRRAWRAGDGLLWAEGVVAEVILFAAAERCCPVWAELAADPAGILTKARWALSALSTDLAALVAAQALHGASFGATHLAAMHYLCDYMPPEPHASAQGFYAVIGTAPPFGLLTPLAGWLYGAGGGEAFWAMAALALAAPRSPRAGVAAKPREVISGADARQRTRRGECNGICGLSSSARVPGAAGLCAL